MRKRQSIDLTITTPGDLMPVEMVRTLLAEHGVQVSVDYAANVEELPDINRERLIRVAAWAAGEDAKRRLGLPSEWDQVHWFSRPGPGEETTGTPCGTACCIAGRVAIEDGGVPVFGDYREAVRVRLPGQPESQSAGAYAREALGLSYAQADRLFSGDNDLEAILTITAEILGTDLVMED